MKISDTTLPGVKLITPDVYRDDRGLFMETYRQSTYAPFCSHDYFVQDNYSHSKRGVLRGLHYQLDLPQAKLVFVIRGKIFDVAVDVRANSPTFGQWTSAILEEELHQQLYIPAGFAHGFYVLSDEADVCYKCSTPYNPNSDSGVHWQDPTIQITWPGNNPMVSSKDALLPKLKDISKEKLPVFVSAT